MGDTSTKPSWSCVHLLMESTSNSKRSVSTSKGYRLDLKMLKIFNTMFLLRLGRLRRRDDVDTMHRDVL